MPLPLPLPSDAISHRYTDIALGALMDMLSDPNLLSHQDTGLVMRCTMSIARHLRGRRLLPFLTRVCRSMIKLITETNRPAVVELTFGYMGKLLAVCRSYISPRVLPMILRTVSDFLHSASLAIHSTSRDIDNTLLDKLLIIVEYTAQCMVAYERRAKGGRHKHRHSHAEGRRGGGTMRFTSSDSSSDSSSDDGSVGNGGGGGKNAGEKQGGETRVEINEEDAKVRVLVSDLVVFLDPCF